MPNLFSRRRWQAGLLLALAILPGSALAQSFEALTIVPGSNVPGVATSYIFEFRIGPGSSPVAAGQWMLWVEYPTGYALPLHVWNYSSAGSGSRQGPSGPWVPHQPGSSVSYFFSAPTTLQIAFGNTDIIPGVTEFRLVFQDVVNPATPGVYPIAISLRRLPDEAFLGGGVLAAGIGVTGLKLGTTPAQPLVYASEIIATAAAPVTLANPGPQSLEVPLSYNFSSGEVRHARLECGGGMAFPPGTAVTAGGTVSVGAVNGLGTGAITFSLTAGAGGTSSTDYLSVTGDRRIVGTDPVDCTYSLYDFPSQAQAGGSAGRVATVSGPYLRFAPSTAFASVGRASTADVEADPSYSRFLVSAPTTAGVAALSRLTYGLAAPAPLTAAGVAINLGSLHATGASGTGIVAAGDFTAAANADGSYTGAALDRVYLSTSNANCTAVGIPAATLSATQATFPVGATATDRLLCLAPRAGVAIPVSDYTATLDAVSVAPTVYAVADMGPLAAGAIVRNGTQLQAPLVQVPGNWLARVALTNTGPVDRAYTIAVQTETGATFEIASSKLSGSIPANGTRVIELRDADLDLAGGSGRRGTLVVTVAGPDKQIQGLYQVVNPSNGLVNNHVLVRPGSN